MATFKNLDDLEIGDRFLMIGPNSQPGVFRINFIDKDEAVVLVEEHHYDVYVDDGLYCVEDSDFDF